MERCVKNFTNWVQKHGVTRAYKEYGKDIRDIRNGLIKNLREIENSIAYELFNSGLVQNFIKKNELNIDIFDQNLSIWEVLENLYKLEKKVFGENPEIKAFINYSDRVGNNRPRAALRKFIQYLEDSFSDDPALKEELFDMKRNL